MSEITIIAAMGINTVIGNAGRLPWRMPSELAYFKEETVGNICIMGRKTYESLNSPLPNRSHIVMSRDPDFWAQPLSTSLSPERDAGVFPRDVFPASDVTSALKIANAIKIARPEAKVMVIGGAEIFRQFIGLADKLIISVIHATPEGDVKFPCCWHRDWRIVSCETRQSKIGDECGYSILRMKKNG
jgi:dihydrofolate reductase